MTVSKKDAATKAASCSGKFIFFLANLLNHSAVDETIAPTKMPTMLSSTPNTRASAMPPIAAPVHSGQCA